MLPPAPDLLHPDRSVIVAIDLQCRLLDVVRAPKQCVWNASRLFRGAELFSIPIAATEQYPEKLGATAPELSQWLDSPVAKRKFSAAASIPLDAWQTEKRHQVVVIGIETHICVYQSVLELLQRDLSVHIVVDAVDARHALDHDTALSTLQSMGAVLTTTESVLFQWCGDSRDSAFRAVSKLVRETN